MKSCCLFYFFAIGFSIATAQSQSHIVELLPNKTENAEQVDFYVAKIIDNRIYTENIGIAQKGLLNKKVPAIFRQSLEAELLGYFKTIFSEDDTKRKLCLRVNQILISENTGAFKETGNALVNLDVLLGVDGEYVFLGSFSAEAEKNIMDVTGKHDDRLRAVLKSCLMEFNTIEDKYAPKEEVNLLRPDKAKILYEEEKKGYYISFNELYNNNPIEDLSIVSEQKDENKVKLKNANNKHPTYFGFYDGTHFYLNAQSYSQSKHFVKCEKINDFLLFSDTFINQDKVNGMALAFGILGALASNERGNTLLDLNSGRFIVLTSKRMKTLLKEDYPDYYKRYRKYPHDRNLIKGILKSILAEKGKEHILRLTV